MEEEKEFAAQDFLDLQQKSMETRGFWSESYRSTVLQALLLQYKTEIIRHWYISDFIPNADKVLIKWEKRWEPLTDEELKDKYER